MLSNAAMLAVQKIFLLLNTIVFKFFAFHQKFNGETKPFLCVKTVLSFEVLIMVSFILLMCLRCFTLYNLVRFQSFVTSFAFPYAMRFSFHRWNVGTNPDLAFASFGQDTPVRDRRVLGKFQRPQRRLSLITPPRL